MKPKHSLMVIALSAVLAAPLPALAQSGSQGSSGNPWYTYMDGRLVLLEPDGGDRLDGLRLGDAVARTGGQRDAAVGRRTD